jgi:hypothetical protein
MASVHGTFRQVQETTPALSCIGTYLAAHQADRCRWLLDRPVSNSGRLRQTMLDLAAQHGWQWRVDLSPHVDSDLAGSQHVVATADSVVLDRCHTWLNLAREVIETHCERVWLVKFAQM